MRHILLALLLAIPFTLLSTKSLRAADELPPVVFVPFDKVPDADPTKRSVFLPYEKFMQLWENSQPKPTDPVKPPIGATLNDYNLTGSVKGDLAELTLTGTITGLSDEWAQVILPAGLGMSGFVPGDKGLIVERTEKSLIIHVKGVGKHSFTATVAAPVTGDASGKRSVSFVLPAAGAGRLDLLIPQAEAELNVNPAIAATTTHAEGATRLLAVLGGTNNVKIDWQPPAEMATGEALILSDSETRLSIGERSIRYDMGLDLTILRRPITSVNISIPAETQVLAVDGKDVRTWERVVADDGTQSLSVSFHQPISGNYTLMVRMERAMEGLNPGGSRAVTVDWPSVYKAARATGRIAIVQGEGLVAAVDVAEGVSQIDPKDTQTGASAVAAFRYYAAPPASKIVITRLASDVRAGVHQLVRLGREEDLIAVIVDLDVRKAGIFALALDVPAAWELIDTSGLQLDDSRLAEAKGDVRRLDLALRGRLLGHGQVLVRFKAPPSISRDAVAGTTKVTVARLLDARQVRGTLAVATPSSWSLTSSERTGLTGTEVEELRRNGPLAQLAKELKDDEDLPLGFTFLGTEASTVLAIAPRARELTVRHEELITVAEGHIRRMATLRGEVRYSALPALRVSAPSALDTKLLFKGATLAEQKIVSSADGRSVWELRFQAPITGPFSITVEDNGDVPALTAGTPLPIGVEPFMVLDTTRSNHVCAIAREGTIEITAKAPGLDSVAPADLPAGLHTQGVVAGFQGAAGVPMSLQLTRHDLVTLADGAVTAARYIAVVSEEKLLRVQGEVLLSTRGRPYLELRLPEGANLLEIAVDNRQSRPSRRADGSVVIPLGDGTGLRSQIIAFVYEQQLGTDTLGSWGSLSLGLPELDGSRSRVNRTTEMTKEQLMRPLPVGPVTVDLYLPHHLMTCGWGGDVLPVVSGEPLWGVLLNRLGDVQKKHNPHEIALPGEGLTVPVTINGKRHHLQRLGDGGHVEFGFIGSGLLHVFSLLALVLGGLGMWFARNRQEFIAGLALSAAIFVAAISAPWFSVMVGFAAGVYVVLAVLLLRVVVNVIRKKREKPTEVTADPWLEQPLPLPLGPTGQVSNAPVAESPAPTGQDKGTDSPQNSETKSSASVVTSTSEETPINNKTDNQVENQTDIQTEEQPPKKDKSEDPQS